eukprot:2624816-Prymnesium_polylepis.1
MSGLDDTMRLAVHTRICLTKGRGGLGKAQVVASEAAHGAQGSASWLSPLAVSLVSLRCRCRCADTSARDGVSGCRTCRAAVATRRGAH